MISIEFHRLAAQELQAVDDRYVLSDQDVADRFIRAIKATLELICVDPLSHAVEVGDIRSR